MQKANINGVTLEYEVIGAGDPLLLIGGAFIADGYVPLVSRPELAGRCRLIRYHKRGMSGSTHTATPVGIPDHANDAANLLDQIGVTRATVVGHSTGGAIALQMAIDRPDLVESLVLLEPMMLDVPSTGALVAKAGPSFQAYGSGDKTAAVTLFLSAVSGLDWETCRATLRAQIPGGIDQAVTDADTFFTNELPAIQAWTITAEQAAAISQPVLTLVGTRTEPLFVEAAERLQRWLPRVEQRAIDGVGHLLHMQNPAAVARAIAEFCSKHQMPDVARSRQKAAAL